MPKNKITIIGAGSWGTALARLLIENNHFVILYSKNKKYGKKQSEKIKSSLITSDLALALENSKFIFIVTPSKALREVSEKLTQQKISKDAILVICSKGIDNQSGKLCSEIIKEFLPENDFAVLSGPNFASEVIAKFPTVTTIASTNKIAANKVIKLLQNNYFLPLYSDDPVTTQICGAVKNILAIGCGIIEGLKLGENAKAALILKGIGEINLLAAKFGGKPETLISPAGFGDLFLTCSSRKSRNNSLGILIGKGADPKIILNDNNKTYEGAVTAKSIVSLAKKHKINLSICQAIHDILYKNSNKISLADIKKIIHQSIFSK